MDGHIMLPPSIGNTRDLQGEELTNPIRHVSKHMSKSLSILVNRNVTMNNIRLPTDGVDMVAIAWDASNIAVLLNDGKLIIATRRMEKQWSRFFDSAMRIQTEIHSTDEVKGLEVAKNMVALGVGDNVFRFYVDLCGRVMCNIVKGEEYVFTGESVRL